MNKVYLTWYTFTENYSEITGAFLSKKNAQEHIDEMCSDGEWDLDASYIQCLEVTK